MQMVQEIYQNVILSLPEDEQLKLACIDSQKDKSETDNEIREAQTHGATRKVFGMW